MKNEGALDRLPEFVAGNMLLMVQEALNNALRHAHPHAIGILVGVDAKGTTLFAMVRDDGIGFDPVAAKGSGEGHFGLAVMKERAERLGGTLRIESLPGRGTTIHIAIALKAYDAALNGTQGE